LIFRTQINRKRLEAASKPGYRPGFVGPIKGFEMVSRVNFKTAPRPNEMGTIERF
jgi:hypothetical protein